MASHWTETEEKFLMQCIDTRNPNTLAQGNWTGTRSEWEAVLQAMMIEQPRHLPGGALNQQDPWPARSYTYESVREKWFELVIRELEQLSIEMQAMHIETERMRIETEQSRLEREQMRIERMRIETEQTRLETEQTRLETEQTRLEREQRRIENEQMRQAQYDAYMNMLIIDYDEDWVKEIVERLERREPAWEA